MGLDKDRNWIMDSTLDPSAVDVGGMQETRSNLRVQKGTLQDNDVRGCTECPAVYTGMFNVP